jgi:hypothetical protein
MKFVAQKIIEMTVSTALRRLCRSKVTYICNWDYQNEFNCIKDAELYLDDSGRRDLEDSKKL